MKLQSTEKSSVILHHRVNQGLIAMLGSLVVISVFMLVLGATPAQAQSGQDPRCAGFSGQAKGLCTAAVSIGCFDGVQSQECEQITYNWSNNCSSCAGAPPPWAVTCPCEGLELDGVFFDDRFDSSACVTSGVEAQIDGLLTGIFLAVVGENNPFCVIGNGVPDGEFSLMITAEEQEACAELLIQIADNDGVTCQ